MERKNWKSYWKRAVTVLGILIASVITVLTLAQCQSPGYEGMFANKDAVSADKQGNIKDATDNNKSSEVNNSGTSQNKEDPKNDITADRDVKSGSSQNSATQTPIFQKDETSSSVWFNSEPHNYTVKFPDWMSKKVTEDDDLVLSGNSLGKEVLDESEKLVTPHFTISTKYFTYSKYTDGEFDTWFAKLQGSPDETVNYKGMVLKLASVDSGGPYMRRALTPIAMSGAVQLDLVYYSNPDISDENFNTKVKEAFYSIINQTQELYLSM